MAWYPVERGLHPLTHGAREPDLFKLAPLAHDAPLAASDARFPVVLLSHGTGGSAWDFGWIGPQLAAAGYVAIGVSHHGNTSIEPYLAEGFLCWWERATDLSTLLDALSRAHFFGERMDLDRVFALGFSLGGYTVTSLLGGITDTRLFRAWAEGRGRMAGGPKEFPDVASRIAPLREQSAVFRRSWDDQGRSRHDARVRAAFLLAPAPPVRACTVDSLRAIRTPVAMIVGGGDEEAPPGECARWLAAHLPASTLEVLAAEVGHYVFLREGSARGRSDAPDLCVDAPGVDRAAIHCAVADRILAHFAAY